MHEKLIERNLEIIENLCKEMRIIAAYAGISKALKKRLYSAEYWAKYFMNINNNLIKERLEIISNKK